ncbi:hypothetical protein ASZ90_019347 [hydrocarbon metagenome]|uniref:Carboxypeptidase Q n=1 Tax=hydrocarbon metagenome TaxID=938273 RepID=A0A0W8E3L9_9ZZZZ
MNQIIREKVTEDLNELCGRIGERPPGSEGNHRAVEYVADRFLSMGLFVSKPEFTCIDWEFGEISLEAGGMQLAASIGPYSLPCDIGCAFESVSTVEQLQSTDFTGKIAVLHGLLCQEQLMPKKYVFYNPDHHKEIISLLEQKKPRAILAITGKNPALAGAVYPFPLIEDADFNIPVANLTPEEGEKLLGQKGMDIHLCIDSKRIPSTSCNVIAVKNGTKKDRIVFCAHIDTKKGTPGTIDNGGGVAVMLGLARLLADYRGKYTIELLNINGEDYYAYSGGMKYLADNQNTFNQIVMAINVDGAGLKGSRTTFCSFNSSDKMDQLFKKVFHDTSKFIETVPWYQSDHMMFAMNGRPALALTTEDFENTWSNIAHTAKDTIDLADINILSDTAVALRILIDELNGNL